MNRYIYEPEDGWIRVDADSGATYVYQMTANVEREVLQRALGLGAGDRIPPRALKPLVIAGLVRTDNPETGWRDLDAHVRFEGDLPEAAYEAVATRLAAASLGEKQSERLRALLLGTPFAARLDPDDLVPVSGRTEQDLSTSGDDARGRSDVRGIGDRSGSRNDLLGGL